MKYNIYKNLHQTSFFISLMPVPAFLNLQHNSFFLHVPTPPVANKGYENDI